MGGPQPRNLCLQWFNLRPPKRVQRLIEPFTALLSTYFLKGVWWPQPGEGLTPRGGRGRGGDLAEWLHSLPLFSVIFWGAWPASLHAERPLPSSRVRSGRQGLGWEEREPASAYRRAANYQSSQNQERGRWDSARRVKKQFQKSKRYSKEIKDGETGGRGEQV